MRLGPPLMLPGVPGSLLKDMSWPRALMQETAPFSLMLYIIKQWMTGCLVKSSGNRGYNRPRTCNPPNPAAHYGPGHGNSTPQVIHSYITKSPLRQDGAKPERPWCIQHKGGGDFLCSHSLTRCLCDEGGGPSHRGLATWEAPWDYVSEQHWIFIAMHKVQLTISCELSEMLLLSIS